ncbi:MAG: ATP-binding protein, partial [Deltaproteobacteria bacterium]|nr:ATP-binding protein [Deltaproteobacteria bacterium]
IPEGVIVHRFGPIVYANPRAASAIGYDLPDDLIGKSVLDLLDPSQRKSMEARFREMRKTLKAAPPREMQFLRKDGRRTTAELEAIPIEFDGEPAVITITRDVSDRKRTQARLLQADRMASIGTLAAGVAHEVNNPLAYVISNLDYLAREIPRILKALSGEGAPAPGAANGRGAEGLADGLDDIEATIQDAREGAERVCQIVRDLRTFSRDGEDDLCPVDIHRVLESSINMARREIEKGARLVREFEPVPPVQATESRLGQVFLNLLMNAAQAMPENGSGKNELRVRTRLAGKGRVLIEIEDTGVGIPPENIDQIFQPFFTTKPVGIGTGLGLSICHNIVTTLSGEIAVKSRPGRYTRFSVWLPVSNSHVG